MSRTERAKGARGELEVSQILRDRGWPRAGRTHDGRAQALRGDIANGPAGVHLEVKRHERLNVPEAMRRTVEETAPTHIPVLVHRPSRCEWMATLPLDELLALLLLREVA